MGTVGNQIRSAAEAISRNIQMLGEERGLLSQNVLAQIRNLIEGTLVRLNSGSANSEFHYDAVEPALAFVKGIAKFSYLAKFHKLIQKSASHYTLDEDGSERLMLKYYEYLHRMRRTLQDDCAIAVLENLEGFPVNLDSSLSEYHQAIAQRVGKSRLVDDSVWNARYYIHKTRPFFVSGRIYYEITCYLAVNKVSKFDRIIAFTDIDITENYAAMLVLHRDSIQVLGRFMPITIIQAWSVSVRPCEFDNFARLFGETMSVRTTSSEYQNLMRWLTDGGGSLVDLVEMNDDAYAAMRQAHAKGAAKLQIFPQLDRARQIIRSRSAGQNVLRYILLRLHNQIIKQLYSWEACDRLSNLKLSFGCIPFETMPFSTSLPGHNPRFWDLIESLDVTGRAHELLARRVLTNVESHGDLYTAVADLEQFGAISDLISAYNGRLYFKHTHRHLVLEMGHVFIRGYEDQTVAIVKKLQESAASKIDGYTQAVERWLGGAPRGIDDPVKQDALKRLFSQSRVALIYGAAGTGKSTMVNHIADYFNDKQKLFLAHTHPAVDNLKRRVKAQNSEFRTISSQIRRKSAGTDYDLLVIDECSTVSNSDMLGVLANTSFKLLVLVGDVYQIQAIEFGNWFGIIRSFIPAESVFELTTPYRAKSESLVSFWNKVRRIEDDIAESMVKNNYTTVLDKTFFEALGKDEVILCLNYDGLYGINNINRFLQSGNDGDATIWRMQTYKVGDPVLFNEIERFRPVIYNNLKGRIVGIHTATEQIQFDVELDRPLSEFDVEGDELEWLTGSTVRFAVYEKIESDEDDDSINTTVPFQVAYAVSIHKAQGLEYDSVKIVITDGNEDAVTHSIFYTAITRARERLRVFWTPETQQTVLARLAKRESRKDVQLLVNRTGLTPM